MSAQLPWGDLDGIRPASIFTPPDPSQGNARGDLFPLDSDSGASATRPVEPTDLYDECDPRDAARERKQRIIQASVRTDVFRQLTACPADVWFKVMTLANLGQGETRGIPISWLDYGRALARLEDPNQPELDPEHPEFKRAQDACRKRGARAWEDICTWETETGWRLVVRDIGGQTADAVNEKSKFAFPFLDVMDEVFEEAKADERTRQGFDGNAVFDAAVSKIACLQSPETPVQILQEHITRPNTARRKATVARAITTLDNIEKDYRLDRTGFFKVYDWVNARTSKFAILPFTQTDKPVSEGDFDSVVAWVQAHAPNFGYVVDVTPADDGPGDDDEACTYSSSSDVQEPEAEDEEASRGGDALASADQPQEPGSTADELLCTKMSNPPSGQRAESESSECKVPHETVAPETHAEPIVQHPAPSQEAAPSIPLPRSGSNPIGLTQHRAQASTLTLADFARYALLPEDFLAFVGIGMRLDHTGRAYLCIPHFAVDGTLLGRKQRVHLELPADPTQRRFGWVEGKAGLYGADWGIQEAHARPEGVPALIVCEGITDQLTFRYHGMAAVGLSSAATYQALGTEHLRGIANVVIARDADRAGLSMAVHLSQHLMNEGYKGGIFAMTFDEANDASEAHKKAEGDRAKFKAAFRRSYDATVLSMRDVKY